ncbi:hypothetical protein D3C71_1763570 [compost metagenome]
MEMKASPGVPSQLRSNIPQPVLSPKELKPCMKMNFQMNPTITRLRIYGIKKAARSQEVVFSFMSSTSASAIASTLTSTM